MTWRCGSARGSAFVIAARLRPDGLVLASAPGAWVREVSGAGGFFGALQRVANTSRRVPIAGLSR